MTLIDTSYNSVISLAFWRGVKEKAQLHLVLFFQKRKVRRYERALKIIADIAKSMPEGTKGASQVIGVAENALSEASKPCLAQPANNPPWISIKDELPARKSFCLACYSSGKVRMIRGEHLMVGVANYGVNKACGRGGLDRPTHWMHLPEPPNNED